MKQSNVTWEWLAGFFDGEGCIFYLHRKYSKSCRYIQCHVTQKNEQVIKDIYEFLHSKKISVRMTKYDCDSTHRCITSSQRNVIMWLENMLPYLRVKKQKATEAITFGKSFLRTNLSLDIVHKILKSKEKGCKLSKRLNISPASVSTIRKRHGILKKDCKE